MKLLFVFLCICMTIPGKAQFWKEKAAQAKETARQKAEQKMDQKVQEGVDQGIEKADSVVSGKKKIFGKKKKSSKKGGSNPAQTDAEDDGGVFVIKTNIHCDAGKQLIEKLLRQEEGITSVAVDTGSGKAFIMSATDSEELYERITSLICTNGFTADGKKATAKVNACKP